MDSVGRYPLGLFTQSRPLKKGQPRHDARFPHTKSPAKFVVHALMAGDSNDNLAKLNAGAPNFMNDYNEQVRILQVSLCRTSQLPSLHKAS